MAPVSTDSMRENLLDYFPSLGSSAYLSSVCKLGRFLSLGPETPEFKRGMEALEQGIGNAITDNIHQSWDIKEGAQDVLRSHLRTLEMTDGFSTPERSPVFMGFVTHGPFLAAIKDGMHWEDLGAGSQHGRYTHRLQWYVAARAGVFDGDASPVQAFQELGRHFDKNPVKQNASGAAVASSNTSFQPVGPYAETTNGLSAWDIVCDRFPGKPGAELGDESDFRAPERMHAWLRKQRTYPKVAAILSGLSAHHPDQTSTVADSMKMADIYALRVYNRTAASMGPGFKDAFDSYFDAVLRGRKTGILTFRDGNKTANSLFKPPSPSRCYITTATCESQLLSDDCQELQLLRRFRDLIMLSSAEGRAEVEDYYRWAPEIVKRLDSQPNAGALYAHLYQRYIQPAAHALWRADLVSAHLLYRLLVVSACALSADNQIRQADEPRPVSNRQVCRWPP